MTIKKAGPLNNYSYVESSSTELLKTQDFLVFFELVLAVQDLCYVITIVFAILSLYRRHVFLMGKIRVFL